MRHLRSAAYYKSVEDHYRRLDNPFRITSYVHTSVWSMLLEEAVCRNDIYVIEWFLHEMKLRLTGKLYHNADAIMQCWLSQKGCPIWPCAKSKVVISSKLYDGIYDREIAESDGERGTLAESTGNTESCI